MKKIDKLLVFFIIIIKSYLQMEQIYPKELNLIYEQPDFYANYYTIMLYFLDFAIYAFVFYTSFIRYIKKQALIIAIKYKSRKILMRYILFQVMGKVFVIKFFEFILLSSLSYLLYNNVVINNWSILLKSILLNILIYFLLIVIQMWIEIYINAKIALLSILSYYLFSIVLGILLYENQANNIWYLILMPNLAYNKRFIFCQSDYPSIIAVTIIFTAINILLIKRFEKKDLI